MRWKTIQMTPPKAAKNRTKKRTKKRTEKSAGTFILVHDQRASFRQIAFDVLEKRVGRRFGEVRESAEQHVRSPLVLFTMLLVHERGPQTDLPLDVVLELGDEVLALIVSGREESNEIRQRCW